MKSPPVPSVYVTVHKTLLKHLVYQSLFEYIIPVGRTTSTAVPGIYELTRGTTRYSQFFTGFYHVISLGRVLNRCFEL